MKSQYFLNKLIIICFQFLLFESLCAQDSLQTKNQPVQKDNRLIFQLSKQDLILPITSIEWGTPDRWSITSRYIHSFEKEKKRRLWHSNFTVSISPGLSGARLGAGFLGIYSPPLPSLKKFALFTELGGVLLRTWGNPLLTHTNTTFVGAELKFCISWILNATIGYYSPLSTSGNYIKSFWGFHFGIGI